MRTALRLDYGRILEGEGKSRIDNVSAAAVDAAAGRPPFLWTATDEGLTIERLAGKDDGSFGAAAAFSLEALFAGYPPLDDKGRREKEADIEGLAFDAETRRLWVAGSHARVRKSPRDQTVEKLLGEGKLKRSSARTLLGRVDVAADGTPAPGSARRLPLGRGEGTLIAAIEAEWPDLGTAMARPAKENGLDIEGLAVAGPRIFLGLRGPVIGPYALVLEIAVEPEGANGLALAAIDGHRVRPHLIETGGRGVRDLAWHPKGLLVLAGPALDTRGEFSVLLAEGLLAPWCPDRTGGRGARHLVDLDTQGDTRRPEAITVAGSDLLVVYERRGEGADPAVLMGDRITLPALAAP